MADQKIDTNLNMLKNQILEAVFEKFDNITLPTLRKEGRFGYNIVIKLPCFDDGSAWRNLVTEEYVNKLLTGLVWKSNVRVSTTENITIATALNVGDVIDGVTLVDEDRVLVQFQTDKSENGIWVVGATPVRSTDMDESFEFNNAVVQINEGTSYATMVFRCKTIDPDVDIDDVEFEDFTPIVPDSTESVKGKVELADDSETLLGNSRLLAVDPAGLKSVLDPIRLIINALSPPHPSDLSGLNIVMTVYSALEAGTGTVHANCTDDTSPDGTIEHFYDGDTGTLSCEVDSSEEGSRILSTASDVGTYGYLMITADEDPIAEGEPGHGLYKQLSATIRPTSNLSLDEHTYQLKHTITGNSAIFTFNVDNPSTPTISAITITLPVLTRWVSGVPSLKLNDILLVSFTVANAVKKHYHATLLARIQGTQLLTLSLAPPVTPPVEDASVDYVEEQVLVLSNAYSEDVQVQIIGYNSKAVAGTQSNNNTSSRVDTVSDESTRRTAGSGEFPETGYNETWDSEESLKTVYTEELQLLNGLYQRPLGDYSGNLPTAGEDYSTGMGTAYRYVLLNLAVTLESCNSFLLTLQDTEGTWNGIETSGIRIQIKVEGSTGWLDANKAFSLLGAPSEDGDACMIYSESTEVIKKVSFGNIPRSGILLIRIGLYGNSDKKFSQSVTVTNIV